jgi:A/G-specific adenine glycosylase
MVKNSLPKTFSKKLLEWNNNTNHREMPWRGERNPYLVWLSEVMLQQTRVEQGLPYFVKFKENYPTVKQLADAPTDEVMRLWQGLGYYSRARNLHATAKFVAYDLKGKFPNSYEEIIQLKGVGAYTAAAIASFCFDEKKAVVDGNVIRVLARVFGIATPFDATNGKKEFATLAQTLIDSKDPGAYNQAIMDFGATVCVPQNPKCEDCPLQKSCFAYEKEMQAALPVRAKKLVKRVRYFYYLVIKDEQNILLHKRTEKDIWQELYELPMIETDKPLKKNVKGFISKKLETELFEIENYSMPYKQQLSHQTIHSVFVFLKSNATKRMKEPLFEQALLSFSDIQKVQLKNLNNFAFPKVVHLFLQENSLL